MQSWNSACVLSTEAKFCVRLRLCVYESCILSLFFPGLSFKKSEEKKTPVKRGKVKRKKEEETNFFRSRQALEFTLNRSNNGVKVSQTKPISLLLTHFSIGNVLVYGYSIDYKRCSIRWIEGEEYTHKHREKRPTRCFIMKNPHVSKHTFTRLKWENKKICDHFSTHAYKNSNSRADLSQPKQTKWTWVIELETKRERLNEETEREKKTHHFTFIFSHYAFWRLWMRNKSSYIKQL